MTTHPKTFGASVGEIFASGIRGYLANALPLTLAGIATLGVYTVFRIPAQRAFEAQDIYQSLAIDLVGLFLASIVAMGWYAYALAAFDGRKLTFSSIIENFGARFMAQAVASFWFWAAILLGLRYLLGIPSLLAVVFYAFYGYVIADGKAKGGLAALGYSAKLGDGKRIGLAALAIVLLLFMLLGAFPLGFGTSTAMRLLAVLGLVVTSSIILVAGAGIYRLLDEQQAAEPSSLES